jgi:hypothetical protein
MTPSALGSDEPSGRASDTENRDKGQRFSGPLDRLGEANADWFYEEADLVGIGLGGLGVGFRRNADERGCFLLGYYRLVEGAVMQADAAFETFAEWPRRSQRNGEVEVPWEGHLAPYGKGCESIGHLNLTNSAENEPKG